MMSYYDDNCPRGVPAHGYMGFINPRALPATYFIGFITPRSLPATYVMGFRIMHKAVGMLLRDLEPSFSGLLPWQRNLCVQ